MKLASPQKRIAAKAVDLIFVVLLGLLIPRGIGAVLAFLYSLSADSIRFRKGNAQSLGKMLFKLKTVEISSHQNIRLKKSLIRNAPIGVVTFFAIFPIWGWALAILIGIPLFLIEAVLVFRADRHQRLGDVMADTEVMDLSN